MLSSSLFGFCLLVRRMVGALRLPLVHLVDQFTNRAPSSIPMRLGIS